MEIEGRKIGISISFYDYKPQDKFAIYIKGENNLPFSLTKIPSFIKLYLWLFRIPAEVYPVLDTGQE
jgi:hypothetical protein